jgi:hypothetical protein
MRASPERTSTEIVDEPYTVQFAGPVYSAIRWVSTGALALLASGQNAKATIPPPREEGRPSALVVPEEMQSPQVRLERLIKNIATHRYVTRQEAQETALTLNMAELVLKRATPKNQLPTVRALTNLDAALRLMPKDLPVRFSLEWDGRQWAVRESPMR